jgi:hypothetical protein
VLDVTLLLLAVVVTMASAYGFVEDRGCEIACGSNAEQTTRAVLLAAACVGGLVAAVLTTRRARAASALAMTVAVACFVIALGQGISNLS